MKYISLCMPTYGISEWVFPALDSIYSQGVDTDLFEVIVTDNGSNAAFQEEMEKYAQGKNNLIYKKTTAPSFTNQIEALRLGSGEYLKFLNHRSILEPESLAWMIETVKANLEQKPVMYWSDGALGLAEETMVCHSFDAFVRGLRDFASWTTGVGVWKSDFEKLPENKVYNPISPHSDVLFMDRKRDEYVINDHKWEHEIDSDHTNKGKYDLYKAFAVEEISVTLGLYNDGDITAETFKYVRDAYEKRVVEFYLLFNILKRPCSYKIDGFEDAMGIFLNKKRVLRKAYIRRIQVMRIFQR